MLSGTAVRHRPEAESADRGLGATILIRVMLLFVPSLLLFVILPLLTASSDHVPGEGIQRVDKLSLKLRETTKDSWMHAYSSYMAFAYPEDELKPISCKGQGRDLQNPGNYARNDVNPNCSMTHLDLLSSLPIFKGEEAFRRGIDRVLRDTNFDQDVKIQVFEVTIRILGSFLSSYQQLLEFDRLASLSSPPITPIKYLFPCSQPSRQNNTHPASSSSNVLTYITSKFLPSFIASSSSSSSSSSQSTFHAISKRPLPKRATPSPNSPTATALLNLAVDLADRLMPAFDTPHGIPYARVNLRWGSAVEETQETCTAGAGSLVLEFSLLSRLTGDPKYEMAARKAFFALWKRRSSLNLMGNSIGVTHGFWLTPGTSTIGAGVDSFFEYALKAGVMLDDDEYMDTWQDAYAGVMQHLRTPDGYMFRGVHVRTGVPVGNMIDSLSAFWPGLQVLAGDVEGAIKSHLVYWWLWRKYKAMPEGFNYVNKTIEWGGYPLRPEFIESTYHLYRATRDPFYLKVGQRVLQDIRKRTMTRCGFAVIHDVTTGKLEDRMESFLLSETFKYLYLLFDLDNKINHQTSGTVFTTEGHLLSLPRQRQRRTARRSPHPRNPNKTSENLTCPVYKPASIGGLLVGIQGRDDYDYTATVVDMPLLGDEGYWDRAGFCKVPEGGQYHFEIVFKQGTSVPVGEEPPRDLNPHKSKVYRDPRTGDIVVLDAENVFAKVTRRLDGQGLDITSVANLRVRTGQKVWVNDPSVLGQYPTLSPSSNSRPSNPAEVLVRLAKLVIDPTSSSKSIRLEPLREMYASTATFGRSLGAGPPETEMPRMDWGIRQSYLPLLAAVGERKGCDEHSYPILKGSGHSAFVAVAERGSCSFFEKAVRAAQAGAKGLLVVGVDNEGLIRPSADDESQEEVRDIGVIYVNRGDGVDLFERMGKGEVVVMQVDEKEGAGFASGGKKGKTARGKEDGGAEELVIEGMPIKNLRLHLLDVP